MEERKLSGMLGICRKAGKLTIGTEQVVKAIREHKSIALALVSSDASENTVKRIKNCCAFYGIPYETLPFDREELGHHIGKSDTAVVGVSGQDLASAILALKKG